LYIQNNSIDAVGAPGGSAVLIDPTSPVGQANTRIWFEDNTISHDGEALVMVTGVAEVIVRGNTGRGATGGTGGGFFATGHHVVMEDNLVEGTTDGGISATGNGTNSSAVVKNCRISNPGLAAGNIEAVADSALVEGCVLEGNGNIRIQGIDGVMRACEFFSGQAEVSCSENATLEDCIFISVGGGVDITITTPKNMTFNRCKFRGFSFTALDFFATQTLRVIDCDFDGTAGATIGSGSTPDVIMRGCTIRNTVAGSFSLNATHAAIFENNVVELTAAMQLGFPANSTIRGNVITKILASPGTAFTGILVGSNTLVEGNKFYWTDVDITSFESIIKGSTPALDVVIDGNIFEGPGDNISCTAVIDPALSTNLRWTISDNIGRNFETFARIADDSAFTGNVGYRTWTFCDGSPLSGGGGGQIMDGNKVDHGATTTDRTGPVYVMRCVGGSISNNEITNNNSTPVGSSQRAVISGSGSVTIDGNTILDMHGFGHGIITGGGNIETVTGNEVERVGKNATDAGFVNIFGIRMNGFGTCNANTVRCIGNTTNQGHYLSVVGADDVIVGNHVIEGACGGYIGAGHTGIRASGSAPTIVGNRVGSAGFTTQIDTTGATNVVNANNNLA
jgi:hypothetical protein